MTTFLRLYVCVCLIQFITCACKNGAKPCEWESWQPWSSCSRTCGVGYRTRNRNMCCGPNLTDCSSVCYRGDNNKQVEVCNDSCPNGSTLVDDICQCPPLKYGTCCNIDEAEKKKGGIGCARHCTWFNWHSWGDCSTSCGCGTRERTRSRCCKTGLTSTQCTDDCSFEGDSKEMRPCTKSCSSKNGPKGCSLCSWNNWGSWSSCSSPCGGGERKRSRSPCCCSGQTKEDCLADCDLSNTDATQTKSCNQLCLHGGRFNANRCACRFGFTGECCSSEVLVSDCKKCSWQAWQAWEETGEDGKMRRRRELCCRVGQGAEDCRSECGVEEYSQEQILLNADKHLEVNVPMNTSTEVLVAYCKKCSWQAWQAWEETGEDGKMRRRRELCCRVGQSAEDCRSECGVEEYSQEQILLNADKHLEVNVPMNTTTESPHSDLHLYLYAGGISLASVVVTSLAWALCCHLQKKRRDGRSENKPGNVYQMSVRGPEGDDWYEDMDAGSHPADDGN